MNNFEEQLKKWSIKVVTYCHNVATNPEYGMDLTFYSFQSIPKKNPELLILGINPAGEYSYADQFNNPAWGLTVEKQMTVDVFIKGNPFFYNHDSWLLWQNLRKSFYDEQMATILSCSMYMNFISFNTPDIESFLKKKRGKEVYTKCRDFSLELITKIIKPERILCLGTEGCFDILPITNKECLLADHKRLLLKGKLSGFTIYGIPHPSGSRTSDLKRKQIGELLKLDFCL